MYEWLVPDHMREYVNAALRQVERDVTAFDNTCMFVIAESGELCGLPAVDGHSIPRRPVLMRLRASSSDLLEFRWSISAWINVFNGDSAVDLSSQRAFDPIKVGISQASVGRFACGDRRRFGCSHEEQFNPIDVAEFNMDDNRTPILTAYRIVLLVNDQWRKYITSPLFELVRKGVRGSKIKEAQIAFARISEQRRVGSVELRLHLEKLGKAWHIGAYGDVEAHLIRFQSRLRFAAAIMFAPLGLYATVFPNENDEHSMLLSYHKDDKPSVAEAIEGLKTLAEASISNDAYGVELLEKLLLNGFGSVIASGQSYQGLADRLRDSLKEAVRKSSQATMLDELFQASVQSAGKTNTRSAHKRRQKRK